MANLALSGAQRDALFQKLGLEIAQIVELEAMWRKAKYLRTLIRENNDKSNNLGTWSLTGVKIGTNTDKDGSLYVNLTAAAPNLVDIYKDAAKGVGDKVASGSLTGTGTMTLTEANSSGMSGSVVLSGTIATNTDIVLTIIDDWPKRLKDTYAENDENTNAQLNLSQQSLLSSIVSPLSGLISTRNSAFTTNMLSDFLGDFMNMPDAEREFGTMNRTYLTTGNNRDFDKERGILPYFVKAMQDNTTPITVKLQTASTGGSLTADPQNTGSIAISAITVKEWLLPGTLNLVCVDETLGLEQFRVENVLSETLWDASEVIRAENNAFVDSTFADWPLGIKFTIKHAIIETGDSANIFSAHAVSGETSANTDNAKLYYKVTRQASSPIWKIELFKNSARDAANKIGETTTDGTTGTASLSITGSGLTVNFDFDKAAANTQMPTSGDTYSNPTIEIDVCKLGDRFTMSLSNDFAGRFQEFFAKYYKTALNSSASPNVSEGFARAFDTIKKSD